MNGSNMENEKTLNGMCSLYAIKFGKPIGGLCPYGMEKVVKPITWKDK